MSKRQIMSAFNVMSVEYTWLAKNLDNKYSTASLASFSSSIIPALLTFFVYNYFLAFSERWFAFWAFCLNTNFAFALLYQVPGYWCSTNQAPYSGILGAEKRRQCDDTVFISMSYARH